MKPMAGRDEYKRLMKAPRRTTTPCRDVADFTADRLDADQQRTREAMCASCPLWALCNAYAAAARPTVGFWAGRPASEISKPLAVAAV